MKRAIWILWPSFVTGGVATILFFTALDPDELGFVSRMGGYTLGFFSSGRWARGRAPSPASCSGAPTK